MAHHSAIDIYFQFIDFIPLLSSINLYLRLIKQNYSNFIES